MRAHLHKEPTGFMFVAGGLDVPVSSVSKWLTLTLEATKSEMWWTARQGFDIPCLTQEPYRPGLWNTWNMWNHDEHAKQVSIVE